VPGVLYHPHFEPSLSWLRASLLVYDHVWSIVPQEAGYTPSEKIQRHLEKLPETFASVAPHPVDIASEYFVLRALRKAFERIAADPKVEPERSRRIMYDPHAWGSDEEILEIAGIAKIHAAKLAGSVHQMLEDFGLIYGRTDDGFSYTDERAAYLIISFLANRMATRLPMRTITDVDSSFLLSAGCDMIDAGDPVNSRGVLASSVLQFHIPENIGDLSDLQFVELRKRYEVLREDFPLYLRDLGELIQVDEIRELGELKARIDSLVQRIGKDMARIRRSRIKDFVRKWLPAGIGSAVTLGSAFIPNTPSLKYVTGAATVAIQILTNALRSSPIPSRIQGAQSLLLDARKDIFNIQDMADSLDMRPTDQSELL
jgi:hypothetical protein